MYAAAFSPIIMAGAAVLLDGTLKDNSAFNVDTLLFVLFFVCQKHFYSNYTLRGSLSLDEN